MHRQASVKGGHRSINSLAARYGRPLADRRPVQHRDYVPCSFGAAQVTYIGTLGLASLAVMHTIFTNL